MPIVSENQNSDGFYSGLLYAAVFVFVAAYFAFLKICFGTFSLRTAVSDYKANDKIRNSYLDMFTTRDSLLYHISWAKSRGDFDQAKHLILELEKLDKAIDAVEESNSKVFGNRAKVRGEKLT